MLKYTSPNISTINIKLSKHLQRDLVTAIALQHNARTMVPRGAVELVTVKTTLPTLPYPPLEERESILTENLLLRPYRANDIHDLHVMFSDPVVMASSARGKTYSLEESRKVLDIKLSEAGLENQDFIICLASTGEMIGYTGSHRRCGSLGWPEIGYAIRRDHWGKGYATEALLAFLSWWWKLPRSEFEIQVDKSTLPEDDNGAVATECIVTITVETNKASRNVMRKCGLELTRLLPVPDLRDETQIIDLFCHALCRPTTT